MRHLFEQLSDQTFLSHMSRKNKTEARETCLQKLDSPILPQRSVISACQVEADLHLIRSSALPV